MLTIAFFTAYFIPWLVVNSAISLTLGAYDLAEWTSLHPAVRFGDPALIVTLALRIQPLIFIGILTFTQFKGQAFLRIVAIGITLIVTIALLPPIEFITTTGDTNYRQQFALAITTLIIGSIGLSGILGRYRHLIVIGFALVGIGTSIYAILASHELMTNFAISATVGLGGIAISFFYGIIIILNIRRDGFLPIPSRLRNNSQSN